MMIHEEICIRLIIFIFFFLASAATHNVVKFLPGFEGPLPFHLETGYVGVGDSDEFQLFYYFVESEQNPSEDPLILWQTGGPGCSSLSAFMFEIGPLAINKVEYNGTLPTLRLNHYSWNKVANIIYIDSPVETGFSYARGIEDYEMGDIKAAKLSLEFFRKWLMEHPQFLSNPLYMGGDSYSGIPLPILTRDIINANEDGFEPPLNLKGYLLGNPITDPKIDFNSRVPFAHGMGIISDELFEVAKISCKGDYQNTESQLCAQAAHAAYEVTKLVLYFVLCYAKISWLNILEPLCVDASPKPKLGDPLLQEKFEDDPIPEFYCKNYGYLLLKYWANNHDVRKALQIHKGTVRDWIRCNYDRLKYTQLEVASTVEYHKNITQRGYRALIYSGDHDITTPFVGTLTWIKSLNYSIVDDWRAWFVDGQVGGYTREYSNQLTFATVKGGGHTAPEWKPKECFYMFQRWLSNSLL